jgi:transcription antitermination factor NusA-like protein
MSNKAQQLKILRMDASDAKIKVVHKSPPNERMIHVTGNKAQLHAMEEALRERLREFENHHWIVDVEPHVLSLIIGRKGSKIKQIEQEASGLILDTLEETSTSDEKDDPITDHEQDEHENVDEEMDDKVDEVDEKEEKKISLPSTKSNKNKTNKKKTKKKASLKKSYNHLPVRIEIEGTHVCVFGETSGQIEKAKRLINEIIDQNQRSSFLTTDALVAVLMNNKRAKLNNIEKASDCHLKLPPPPPSTFNDGKKKDHQRFNVHQQVEIVLSGTSDAISCAKNLLEELQDANAVRYIPLDADEVSTVIGKKGETISQLEENSGARLRVVQMGNTSVLEPTEGLLIPSENSSSNPAELEMIGTEEQLKSVKQAIDVLLQIQNREILQLDPFATGCLIGKKGERIKALRQKHPEATIDAFPTHGQVRIKASNALALQNAVDAILQFLRDTPVVETIKVPSNYEGTFHTLLKDQPMLRKRLNELEAEGGEGMKVTISDDGKNAKVRGPALGIGNVKQFLDMLLTNGGKFFYEQIQLPNGAFTTALTASTATASTTDSKSKSKTQSKTATPTPPTANSNGLNENGIRIAKQFQVDIRIKANSKSIRIEGKKPENVLQAKEAVHQLLQFYFSDCFHLVDKLPLSLVPQLYGLLPMLNKQFQACFTLVDATSIQVFTDSAHNTQRVVQVIQDELANWRKLHVELPIATWIIPILVGKNGESIKKLSTESGGAKLDLTPVNSSAASNKSTPFGTIGTNKTATANVTSGDRLLTISGTSEEVVNKAKQAVLELIKTQEKYISTVQVPKNLADLVLAIKREASAGINFSVINGPLPVSSKTEGDTSGKLNTCVLSDVVTVQIYGQNDQERKKITEKMQKLAKESVIEKILLPSSSGPTGGAVVGALIGTKGGNIRALQKQFPKVLIDIRSEENIVELKGPKDQVIQVKNVMEDKVKELVTLQLQYQQRRTGPNGVSASISTTTTTTKANHSVASPEDDEQEEEVIQDENARPNPVLGRNGQVPGAPMCMLNANGQKLNKNQRRRMRKRAENEMKSDVLSMLVGSDVPENENAIPGRKAVTPTGSFGVTTSASSSNGGYYHSTSGYTLRL